MKGSILVIDDEADARNLLGKVLEKEGYAVNAVPSAEDGLSALRTKRYSAALLDYSLPGMNGLDALKVFLEEDPDLKIVMVTSHGSVKLAVEAVKKGAFHFLEKPFDLDEVRLAVQQAIQNDALSRENHRLTEKLGEVFQGQYVLGQSQKMRAVWEMVGRVAPSEACVLIEGESGTGKEVIANAIHRQSARAKGPFIAVNCAAFTRELIESELFGHVKGAFTGAIALRKGRFEMADGGTLFLDEIGEIPLDLQSKLLRVLQEKTFERVGDTQSRKVDVRILAATNRKLQSMVKEKTFREDLFFRLNVINIALPALRERREDIFDLAQFFLGRFSVERGRSLAQFSPAAQQFLQSYAYPGNIRELANMIERASILCMGGIIEPKDLAGSTPTPLTPQAAHSLDLPKKEGEVEKSYAVAKMDFELSYLTRVLFQAKGNISLAARIANIDRNNFKDKLKKFGLETDAFRE